MLSWPSFLTTAPFESTHAGIAASTRVGNAIGRRDATGAKFTGHLSALLSAMAGTIVMLSLLATKDVRHSLIPSLPY